MRVKRIHRSGASRLAVCGAALVLAAAGLAPAPARAQAAYLSVTEIERLVAPIALYPDPLIAEVLPASTYPDEVAAAADYVAQYGSADKNIDRQGWDKSIATLARYPEVLNKMADDMDWTADLGDAFLSQPADVMDAIQTCRGVAKERGALESNEQQTIVYEEENIRVVPAQDDVVYVPQYQPQVVYVEEDDDVDWGGVVAAGAVSFGVGMAVGSWLDSDCDWYGGGVYYPHYGGHPSWNSYRHGGNVNVNGDVIVNRPINNYNSTRNWNHDSNRYQNNINRYGDKYNNRYRDQNRAQNRDSVRQNKVANAKRNPQNRNRNNGAGRNNAAGRNDRTARDTAASRDLTKPATRDAGRNAGRTADPSRTGSGGRSTRDTTPAPDRAKKDSLDRQQMQRDRQRQDSASRGRQDSGARPGQSAAPRREPSKPPSYERGSSARRESDRGLSSRQQANPRSSGAFGGGGSRGQSQPRMSGGGGGGRGGGGRGGGGRGGGGRGGGGGGRRGR